MQGVDVAAGAEIYVREIYGDWFRDPWDWFEVRMLRNEPGLLDLDTYLVRDTAEGARLRNPAAFTPIEVPKNSLAVRPAVIIDPVTRLLYSGGLAPQLRSLHSELPSWCFGWRHRGDNAGFSDNATEWSAYSQTLIAADDELSGLNVDITSFFASVNIDRMLDVLSSRLGKANGLGVIADVIRQHDGLASRSGLPQRSFTSAALANVYMRPIDDLLAAFVGSHEGATVTRWVDDINAFAAAEDLYLLHLEIESRARQIGLELNSAKSMLAAVSELKTAQHVEGVTELLFMRPRRGGYGEPDVWVEDEERLEELETEILEKPNDRSTSLLKGVLNSLRKRGDFENAQRWTDVARYLPHAAAAFGRYLRGAINAEAVVLGETQEWLVEFLESPWASLDWVSAQLALSIPRSDMSVDYVRLMQQWLEESNDPQKLATAGQRLAGADPTACRDIVRGRLDSTTNPLILRLFAMTLLESGDDRRLVQGALNRDPRNGLTRQALDQSGWRAKAVASDFDDPG